jgi:hypothetical protein
MKTRRTESQWVYVAPEGNSPSATETALLGLADRIRTHHP